MNGGEAVAHCCGVDVPLAPIGCCLMPQVGNFWIAVRCSHDPQEAEKRNRQLPLTNVQLCNYSKRA